MVPLTHCPIDRQAEHRLIELVASHAADEWVARMHAYTPQLVNLLAEIGDRPVRRYTDRVRRIVGDYQYCDEAGDPCGSDVQALERHVQLLVDALEQLRSERQATDRWASMPAAPPMFG